MCNWLPLWPNLAGWTKRGRPPPVYLSFIRPFATAASFLARTARQRLQRLLAARCARDDKLGFIFQPIGEVSGNETPAEIVEASTPPETTYSSGGDVTRATLSVIEADSNCGETETVAADALPVLTAATQPATISFPPPVVAGTIDSNAVGSAGALRLREPVAAADQHTAAAGSPIPVIDLESPAFLHRRLSDNALADVPVPVASPREPLSGIDGITVPRARRIRLQIFRCQSHALCRRTVCTCLDRYSLAERRRPCPH